MKFIDIIKQGGLLENNKNPRTQSITKEKALKIVDKKCVKETNIYRGTMSLLNSGDYGFVDPNKYTRQSANSNNFYTLCIDNLPEWSRFPKRSKSIVCSTNRNYAVNFGELYRVYPFKGYDVGVAPNNDIWGSFSLTNEIFGSIGFFNIDDFHSEIVRICRVINSEEPSEKSFSRFKSDLNKISFEEVKAIKGEIRSADEFIKYWENNVKSDNLFGLYRHFIDPDNNSFSIKSTESSLPPGREVWTQAPCILVRNKP